MALTVNTNVAALNAQKNLNKSQNMINKSMERVSSGLRINSAADDAAGLAIGNKFETRIAGTNMAIKNANDGTSLAQIAESGLTEVTSILQRMKELAVQSSNSTLTADDRSALQVEVAALITEIDRIATTSDFNGKKLLDGSYTNESLQIGDAKGDSMSVSISNMKSDALGSETLTTDGEFKLAKKTGTTLAGSSVSSMSTAGNLATLDAADLTINGVAIGAAKSSDDTASNSDQTGSAISMAAAINAKTDTTGVTAVAKSTRLSLGTYTAGTDNMSGDDFKINGVSISLDSSHTIQTAVAGINDYAASTGVIASISGATILLRATDGRNIDLSTDGTATDVNNLFANFTGMNGGTSVTAVQKGTIDLYGKDDIALAGNEVGVLGSNYSSGSISVTESALTTYTTAGATYFEAMTDGDLTVNGYSVNMAAKTLSTSNERSTTNGTASAQNIALQINNTTGLKDEVTATAKTVANLGKVSAATSVSTFIMKVNGAVVSLGNAISEDDADGYLAGSLNAAFNTGSTTDDIDGLVASVNTAGELLITASDGRNVVIETEVVHTENFLGNLDVTATANDVVAKGTVSLTANAGYTVSSVAGAKEQLAGIASNNNLVSNIDVSTAAGATNALSVIDDALKTIDSQRASLGAVQNRLEYVVNDLTVKAEKFAAAKSRIMDADFAKETASLSKGQILQQAGMSILAQANASQQSVLSLLG